MEKLENMLPEALPGQILPENIENLSKAEKKICPDCGAEITPVTLHLFTKTVLRYPPCDCEMQEYQRQEEARIKRERQARIERLFANSGLEPRYSCCTFENWTKRRGTENAYKAAFEYAENIGENIRDGRGFLVFGPPGNGKSHLAAAVVNTALRKGHTAIFERVPKLLARIRATYQGGEVTEYQIMKTLTDADLLVLDDAGAEKWTEWTEPTLYTIVDERYTHNKALIVTTNSNLDELDKKIGFRAMDRILEMCEIVENKGTSFRQERARARTARTCPNVQKKR